MPEALARAPRGPVLTAPVRDVPLQRKAQPLALPWRRLLPKGVSGYAGYVLALALLGIVVNAVVLQRERHPAPFFAGDPTPPASAPAAPLVPAPPANISASAPAPAPMTKAAPVETVPPLPPARPLERTPAPTTSAHVGDALGELIRASNGADAKTVAAVQKTLVRAGYVLTADGVLGDDTVDALKDFEKTHGMPISTELTPRLLNKLTAAAH